jgi:shikimate kinase
MDQRSFPTASGWDHKHIVLIGFMCTGKSTVGKALATLLSLPFVDIDRVVEQRVGPLVPYFQRQGEAAFRVEERTALHEQLAGARSVIATGGGTPCEGDNLSAMKAAGVVIWLDVAMHALMPRIIRAGGDRPLLLGLRGEALEQRVSELMTARADCYAQADIIVQAGAPVNEVAARIQQVLALQAK